MEIRFLIKKSTVFETCAIHYSFAKALENISAIKTEGVLFDTATAIELMHSFLQKNPHARTLWHILIKA